MKGQRIIALSLAALAAAAPAIAPETALACEETGRIEISYAAESGKAAISGARFGAAKVLSLEKGAYVATEAGKKAGASEKKISVAPETEARALEQRMESAGYSASAITDANGKASLKASGPGVYLVSQTGSEGKADGYLKASPALVTVTEKEEQECAITAVSVSPKTEAKKLARRAPKTGDATEIAGPAAALAASAGAIAWSGAVLRRKKKGESGSNEKRK